jgi:YfiH family protein
MEHPSIKFTISSLGDTGLFLDEQNDFEELGVNWEKYWEDQGIDDATVMFMEQTHGDVVTTINHLPKNPRIIPLADAMITHAPKIFLAVKSADCLPVLLYDPIRKVVAVVHAGWRGTAKKILQKVVRQLKEEGSDTKNIYAILGPSICSNCYDVTDSKDDRIALFEEKFGSAGVVRTDNKIFLDVLGANKLLLKNEGILEKNIVNVSDCTMHGVVAYPSNYKDKDSRRLISMIGITS